MWLDEDNVEWIEPVDILKNLQTASKCCASCGHWQDRGDGEGDCAIMLAYVEKHSKENIFTNVLAYEVCDDFVAVEV